MLGIEFNEISEDIAQIGANRIVLAKAQTYPWSIRKIVRNEVCRYEKKFTQIIIRIAFGSGNRDE